MGEIDIVKFVSMNVERDEFQFNIEELKSFRRELMYVNIFAALKSKPARHSVVRHVILMA
jgi:hypothetical protein